MKEVVTVGIDIAKNVFQVHGVDAQGVVVVRRKLRRSEVSGFFESLPPCLIGIEACATAHHWARHLMALGHEGRHWPQTSIADAKVLSPSTSHRHPGRPPHGPKQSRSSSGVISRSGNFNGDRQ